jgi:exodeoxyribonuclease V alpha subunit
MENMSFDDVANLIRKIMETYAPNDPNFWRSGNVQIISPTKVGAYGTNILNETIQKMFNEYAVKEDYEGKYRIELKGKKFLALGDKVISMKNDHDRQVMNGDVGIIRDITENHVNIEWDNHQTQTIYSKDDPYFRKVKLGYAVTVHKAQGSDYDLGIILVPPKTRGNRKLLNTDITRNKKESHIIYHNDTWNDWIKTDVPKRNTGLVELLREYNHEPTSYLQGILDSHSREDDVSDWDDDDDD